MGVVVIPTASADGGSQRFILYVDIFTPKEIALQIMGGGFHDERHWSGIFGSGKGGDGSL